MMAQTGGIKSITQKMASEGLPFIAQFLYSGWVIETWYEKLIVCTGFLFGVFEAGRLLLGVLT